MRKTMMTFNAQAFLIILLSFMAVLELKTAMAKSSHEEGHHGHHHHPPSRIVYYLHVESGVTFVDLANNSAAGGITADLHGFALPMTANLSRTSKSLGYVRGVSLDTSGMVNGSAPSREQLFNTIDYNDGVYNGTISQHGQISYPPTAGTEIAVVGGTGAFRRVQGYSIPTLVSMSPTVFRWEVHLFYPSV